MAALFTAVVVVVMIVSLVVVGVTDGEFIGAGGEFVGAGPFKRIFCFLSAI